MRILDAGHIYEVENVDGPGSQRIVFVRRRDIDAEMLSTSQRHEGILAQELLRVLIDRTRYLYDEAPCDEDTAIITKLRECLALYESRASRRVIEKLNMPEHTPTCPVCGHILCRHMIGAR